MEIQVQHSNARYITELKSIAKHCKFGVLHDEFIRDRIVCGVNNEKVKERLLRDGELTLTKATGVCRACKESFVMIKKNLLRTGEESVASVTKKTPKKQHNIKEPKVLKPEQGPAKSMENQSRGNIPKCGECGSTHASGNCPAYGKQCHQCHKPNHFKKCCQSRNVCNIDQRDIPDGNVEPLFIGSVEKSSTEIGDNEIFVNLKLHQTLVKFKVDTGSQANIIPLSAPNKFKPKPRVEKSSRTLTSYTGNKLSVIGKSTILYDNKKIDFYIVDSKQWPILGFNTSQDLGIIQVVLTTDMKDTCVNTDLSLKGKDPKEVYPSVFKGLGCLEKSYHIKLDTEVRPVVNPPRNVPAALRERLKDALEEMEKGGAIRKVDHSTEWVNSLVIVEKPSGKLRICLDSRSLNTAIKREHYQLPTIEDIVSRMAKAKVFSKLDANHGYWQIALDEESRELTTCNTPFGRFCYTRMPFGIKWISQHFDDLHGVETDIDDILVWGRHVEEHGKNLKRALDRWEEIRLTLNGEKCRFRETQVYYIGHQLASKGIKSDPEKVYSDKGHTESCRQKRD